MAETPYRIKAGGRGFIVWETGGGGIWREIATFAERSHAEDFVFIASGPCLGAWR